MQKTARIRVLIADDHDLLRSGLALFIRTCPDLELIGEAASGDEVVRLCDTLQPDVVIMDLMMPGLEGVTATRVITANHPKTRVVALTSFDNEELVQSVIQAGAISYLLKNITTDHLATAIRAAYDGKSTLAREAAQALVNATHRPTAEHFRLTGREREVLAMMIKGLTNVEIAAHLNISHSTAKKHVSNILAKLQTTTRTEAVAVAVQNRLISAQTN
ncbi:MAG: response regulator transcription factor [Anaerolinea sp.]|nr:response regulator transcription factor [Anaerolinea sp.]